MERTASSETIFRFGLYEANVANNTLKRNGARVKIQDQPFRVLILLLQRPGEIVTREELRQNLWPEGTFVDFDGSLNVILKKLRAALDDDSDNPRFIETIPRRGYRFIAPVSVKFEDAIAENLTISSSVVNPTVSSQVPVASAGNAAHNPTSSILVYAVAGMALLLLVVFTWISIRPKSSSGLALQASAKIPLRRSVAVLGFHNASGRSEDAWLSAAFSEMLSTELAGGEKLRIVSGEEISNLRVSSPWPQSDSLNQITTARIGTALNSDILVLGSYASIGRQERGQLRLDVRLQDARTGEILAEMAQTGDREDVLQLVSAVGVKLRDRLGVPQLTEPEQAGVLASTPQNREAARLYALGLSRLREFDALAAKDLLQQACAADPKFALGHLMLARAWGELGYEQKRKEEARKALDLSSDLPRAERMLVEGNYYETLPDYEKAASTYRALFELFPDNVDYGLQLAAAQSAAGHDIQTSQTIARLRRLPPPTSDDPRIDLGDVASTVPAGLALARSAMQKAQVQGKKLVYAQSETIECMNLIATDHPEQAAPACEDAYNLFWAAGNRLEAADAMRHLADSQNAQGHFDQAIAIFEKAAKILEGLGEHEKTGAVLNNMAISITNQGNLDRGEELYRQARFHFEQAGDKHNAATAMGNIADILYLRGKLLPAEKLYRQTIDINAGLDKPFSYPEYRLADLELTEGRVQEAHKLAQQAVDTQRVVQGDYGYLSGAMDTLGDVLEAQGSSEAARQQYQAALDIGNKAGEAYPVAETQVELSNLALEEGNPDQAERSLRAAIVEFEKEKADPDSANAYIELSRALLIEGKLGDARKAIQHATDLTRTSPDPALKFSIAIQTARVMLAAIRQNDAGHPTLAAVRQQLHSTSDAARRLGYYKAECESRLVLGELEIKANPGFGRAQLTQLAAEAHQHGMEMISRKARALASTATTEKQSRDVSIAQI
jgi:eukaryotic-like serine/threonine-protein kinase